MPESANLERDGQMTEVDPDDVEVGDIIVIRPGEKVPLDGVILSGDSFLDTSALTGESVPQKFCREMKFSADALTVLAYFECA